MRIITGQIKSPGLIFIHAYISMLLPPVKLFTAYRLGEVMFSHFCPSICSQGRRKGGGIARMQYKDDTSCESHTTPPPAVRIHHDHSLTVIYFSTE